MREATGRATVRFTYRVVAVGFLVALLALVAFMAAAYFYSVYYGSWILISDSGHLTLGRFLIALVCAASGVIGLRWLWEGVCTIDSVPFAPVRITTFLGFQNLLDHSAVLAGTESPSVLWVPPDFSLQGVRVNADRRHPNRIGLAVGCWLPLVLTNRELTIAVGIELAFLKVLENSLIIRTLHRANSIFASLSQVFARGSILTIHVRLPPLLLLNMYARCLSRVAPLRTNEETRLHDEYLCTRFDKRDLCRVIVKLNILVRALTMRDQEEPALLNRLNATFCDALRVSSMHEDIDINWFTWMSEKLVEHRHTLWRRIEAAKDQFLTDPTWQDSRDRLIRMGSLPQAIATSLDFQSAHGINRSWGRALSAALKAEYLPSFVMARLACKSHPHLPSPDVAEFYCEFAPCPGFGQVEVTVTDKGIRSKKRLIRWRRILSVVSNDADLALEIAGGRTMVLPCHSPDTQADLHELIAFFMRNWRRLGRTRARDQLDALTFKLLGSSLILAGIGFGIRARFGFIAGIGLQARVLSYIATVLLFGLGVHLVKVGRRRIAQTGLRALLYDDRPPVLYLRSFADDRVARETTSSQFILPSTTTEEEELAEAFSEIGPLIAAGRPNESLPELGATRLYMDGRSWREDIETLMNRASLVVIRPSATPGLAGEIVSALQHVPPERILFLCTWRDEQAYSDFRKLVNPLIPRALPDYPNSAWEHRVGTVTGIIRFATDWEPILMLFERRRLGRGSFVSQMQQTIRPMIASIHTVRESSRRSVIHDNR